MTEQRLLDLEDWGMGRYSLLWRWGFHHPIDHEHDSSIEAMDYVVSEDLAWNHQSGRFATCED